MLESIKLLHDVLWSSTLMMGLCLAAMGYLIYRCIKKKETRTMQICIVFSVLTGVLVCLNPVFGKVLMHVSGDKYTFIRFTWLIPLFLLVAYAATMLILDLQGKRRLIACVVITGLILCAGQPWPPVFKRAENVYKVSNSLKEVCDSIRADGGDGRISVNVYLPDNNIYEDGSDANMRYFGIRQYAPEFVLDRTTITPEQYEQPDFSYVGNMVNRDAYVICDCNDNQYRELEKIGYVMLMENGEYAVFKNTAQFTIVFVRHGQTEANVNDLVIGVLESPLTEEGISKARDAGTALRGMRFGRAYSSIRERAIQTAALVLEASDNGLTELRTMQSLRDINWGVEEGASWSSVREKYGQDANLHSLLGAIEDDEYMPVIENADSLCHYSQMYDTGVHEMITECYVDGLQGSNILLTGHSVAAQWMRYILPTVEVPDGLDNTGVTILQYNCGEWNMITINNTDYEEVAEIVGKL